MSEGQGDAFGFVSDSDIELHSQNVVLLEAEVEAAAKAERADKQGAPGPLTEYRLTKVAPMVADWKQWVEDHTGFAWRFADASFAEQRLKYGQVRAGWLAQGQTTTTPGTAGGAESVAAVVDGVLTKVVLAGAGLGALWLFLKSRETRRER